jgi:hypothetical protein
VGSGGFILGGLLSGAGEGIQQDVKDRREAVLQALKDKNASDLEDKRTESALQAKQMEVDAANARDANSIIAIGGKGYRKGSLAQVIDPAPPSPKPEWHEGVENGHKVGFWVTPPSADPTVASGGRAPGTLSVRPSTAAPSGADGSFDSFYSNFLAPAEGGYADRDGASAAPVNFGVNQKFNPDVDVKSLSQDQAKKILHDRYWTASGADNLPPGLAEIQGDTATNMGVSTANRLLQQSGGDPEKYLQLRDARYRSIGGPDLGTWLNRNNTLRSYVGLQDGTPPGPGGNTGAPMKLGQVDLGPAAGKSAPDGYRYRPDGSLEFIPGGPADPKVRSANKGGANLNESQAKATGYLATAVASVDALNSVKGYNPSVIALALNDMSNKNPIKEESLSQVDRRVLNAQLAFATAALRLESGAVIDKSEYAAKAQTLFPMPGDGPEVQADKKIQREATLHALRIASGPGQAQVHVASPPGGAPAPLRIPAPVSEAPPAASSYLVNPRAVAILPRLSGDGTAGNPIQGIQTAAQMKQLKPGTYFIAPNGAVKAAQ